jgi:hypothetical protein
VTCSLEPPVAGPEPFSPEDRIDIADDVCNIGVSSRFGNCTIQRATTVDAVGLSHVQSDDDRSESELSELATFSRKKCTNVKPALSNMAK